MQSSISPNPESSQRYIFIFQYDRNDPSAYSRIGSDSKWATCPAAAKNCPSQTHVVATKWSFRHSPAMPRYYFHGPGEDDGGEDLPDDAAARGTAFDTFGQIIREHTKPVSLRMEVVDETGRSVVKLVFSAGE